MTTTHTVTKPTPCQQCGYEGSWGPGFGYSCPSCGTFQREAFRAHQTKYGTREERKRRRQIRKKQEQCPHPKWTAVGVSYPAGAGVETQVCKKCGKTQHVNLEDAKSA